MRGHLHEGREKAGRVLALPWTDADRNARIAGLEAAAGIAYWQADMAEARRLYVEALDLAREAGDPAAIANAIYGLSFVFVMTRTDLEKGRALLREAQELYAGLGDAAGVARARFGESTILSQLGDFAGSGAAAREALVEFRRMGDPFLIGWALSVAGLAAVGQGDFPAARDALGESLRRRAATRDLSGMALELYDLAVLAKAQGRRERALRLAGAAAALGLKSGTAIMQLLYVPIDMSLVLERPADPKDAAAWDEGAGMPLDEAMAYGLQP